MSIVQELKKKVLQGNQIKKEDALALADAEPEELCNAANEIRETFCRNGFDICAITNGKGGKCSENCKYCAQAGCSVVPIKEHALLSTKKFVEEAKRNEEQGVLRYSIVTSGKRLSKSEIDKVCESVQQIKKETEIAVCVSLGLLDEEDFMKLKKAGVSRIHNNLESSRQFFPKVCTTHTYDDKIAVIQAAKKAGLSVCSGGIMGIGEAMEDRIDMALTLRELEIYSVPVNMLNPIPGTPLEHQEVLSEDEMCRILAIYRFVLPNASIRMAGGRGLLPDKGERCFRSGANAAISGDMLTTSGITIKKDMEILKRLGYVLKQ